jgi:DNA mismatch repair protein MutS2
VKALDLLDPQTAELLGFGWLANAVAPVSPYGLRRFAELVPFRPGEEASAHSRALQIVELAAQQSPDRVAAVRAMLGALPDVAGALARTALGEALDDSDLLELLRFCETVERIDAGEATRAIYALLLPGRGEAAGFYLSDAFDVNLAAARAVFAQTQAELDSARGRESASVARALGREEIAGDEFIVMRFGLHAPLPGGVRVVREAATYMLCALEYGEASRAALERREAAAAAVAAHEERVRARLSSVVREHLAGLDAAARALAELDVTLAAVRFAQRYDCVAAGVIAEPALYYAGARFLPLEEELAVAGRRFVPIALELRGPAVLTGPNMGGKSVALQTSGFVTLCAAFGLPVPAAAARVGLFDQIAWLGAELQERAGGLLSSYARELMALRAILARDAARLLIFVDEFARTTTPHEGKALVVALAELFARRSACALIATHLPGVAAAARVTHFAVRGRKGMTALPAMDDLKQALDALAASMDYTIAEVGAGDVPAADAIALAQLLGLDRGFVEAAYRALSQ